MVSDPQKSAYSPFSTIASLHECPTERHTISYAHDTLHMSHVQDDIAVKLLFMRYLIGEAIRGTARALSTLKLRQVLVTSQAITTEWALGPAKSRTLRLAVDPKPRVESDSRTKTAACSPKATRAVTEYSARLYILPSCGVELLLWICSFCVAIRGV